MIKLEPATQQDLPSLAAVHKKVYSEAHFTSRFSSELLERYYGHFFDSDCFVVKALPDDGSSTLPIGFVVSGFGMGGRIAAFKREQRSAILLTALANPVAASAKVLADVFYRFFDTKHPYQESRFLILSIASDRSRPGIGAALLEQAKQKSKAIGCDAVGLYVRVSNVKAIRFYLDHGFVIKGYSAGQFYLEAATS
ncbi:GNAT family N-acetyltransferase [Cupriavidus ulmosensis]|uniref:GNAT family N-acetyltransferase n=1 Tax=Cupriavidus ulmosensis TaxID=3065913 RepID=UPI00296AF45D|nr:GNAT family N-acetyltransferase [Cupriavidus sp. CV2]MDW3681717.1 GNAT family N-acetyltransferase [Cupriavidus sp. CV2]